MHRRRFMLGISAGLGTGFLKTDRSAAAADQYDIADVEPYRAAAVERWESEIQKLESRDKTEEHAADSILFVGSSSIRIWKNIAADMAPYDPIQRGYGGARWSDVAVFAERLIWPHPFRAAVFFVGNDITGGDNDKQPAEVARLFAYVWQQLRKHNATAPVFYVAVTPTPRRWAAWPQIKAANSAVRELCETLDETYFVGTESVFLDGQRQPRPELFRKDQLHLNEDGYIRWSAIIKSHLDSRLDGSA